MGIKKQSSNDEKQSSNDHSNNYDTNDPALPFNEALSMLKLREMFGEDQITARKDGLAFKKSSVFNAALEGLG